MNRLQTLDFHKTPFQGFIKSGKYTEGFFHYHQGIEFLYVHQGDGTVVLDQQVYPISPGTLYMFQPFQLHHIKVNPSEQSPYVRTVIHFEPTAFQSYIQPYAGLHSFFVHLWRDKLHTQVFPDMNKSYPIEPVLDDYRNESAGVSDVEDADTCALLLTDFVRWLKQEDSRRSATPQALPARKIVHSEAILQWIEEHYNEPIELDQIAQALHLSKYHVSHLFKEETGRTITEYVLARRVKETCHLLTATSLSIEEIGARVGWPVPSHFIAQFKKWTGRTPLVYRNIIGRA